jgi:xanthine dehydrogenase molybdopterin-binding subunit B
VSDYRLSPRLDAPATPEAVLRAVADLKARAAAAGERKAAA